jgi:hypothetical protein
MATTTYKVQAQFPATTVVPTRAYVSNVAITSNLMTVTTAAAHGITQVGTLVKIVGVSTTIDGTYVIQSIPLTTTFTAVSATATLGSTAVSPVGVATFTPVTSGFLVTNKVVQNYNATITTGSAHSFSVGDFVVVNINDSIYDNLTGVQITGVPTTTTFTYTVATQTSATTAVTQGAVGKTTFQSSYTVAAATQGVSSTLYVSNASANTAYYRIAVQKSGSALANQWIAYDTSIAPNAFIAFTTGLALNAGEILTVQASSNLVTFTLDGSETA